ncbi:pectin lyase fold/virulence factor [Aspergillus varians]
MRGNDGAASSSPLPPACWPRTAPDARSHIQHTSKIAKRYTFPIPESQGSVTLDGTYQVSGDTFDGGLKTYGRGVDCSGQSEGGDSNAVFIVKDGGTLKNVIIGSDQIEGVHCEGSCTIENVWWEATGDGPFNVIGGATVTVSDFTVYDFGKLYRSCGNCDSMYERPIVLEGITAGDDVKTICVKHEGTDNNDEEPEEINNGPNDYCIYSEPLAEC